MKTLGASKTQILTMVVLPASVPTIMNALKLSVGMIFSLCFSPRKRFVELIDRKALGFVTCHFALQSAMDASAFDYYDCGAIGKIINELSTLFLRGYRSIARGEAVSRFRQP